MRRTRAQVAVAVAVMADPYGQHWGYELSQAAGVSAGVMYPMLTRFLEQGLLTDGWEQEPLAPSRRPRRRYYELTDAGRVELGAIAVAAPPEVQAAVSRARSRSASTRSASAPGRPRPAFFERIRHSLSVWPAGGEQST